MNDPRAVLIVVGLLGLVTAIGLGGMIWLVAAGTPTGDITPIGLVTTGALGALASMLSSTSRQPPNAPGG